jgi:hypothetical protein
MSRRPRGALPGWQPTTARQKGILADLVARYQQHHREDTLPRGGNGIFYDLRPRGMGNGVTYFKPVKGQKLGPMEAGGSQVQEVLALARRAGIIPEHWVADQRAASGSVPNYDESAEEAAEFVVGRLREAEVELDPQTHQPVYVEVLCEAADLVPRLDRTTDPCGVPVYTGSGFDGLKGKREMGERAAERDKPTVVLHIGDRNKQGEDIYTAVAEDAIAWAGVPGEVRPVEVGTKRLDQVVARCHGGPALIFARLALTADQSKRHDLLDNDGKAEVDGLPVRVMDRMLIDAIEALQVPARRERVEAEQREANERLPGLIRRKLDEDGS